MNTPFSRRNFRCFALISTVLFGNSLSYAESEISIKTAGADLANFPNSAFTLPQGRTYIEITPVNFSGKSDYSPQQTSAGYLLRYGLFDDLELRLMSSGFAMIDDTNKTNGMNAQIFDLKWHVSDENKTAYLPAVGVEFSVQTDFASRAFQNGINPALSLNFDQSLPFDIAFEYNVGFVSQHLESGEAQYQLALSWALQRAVSDEVDVFINGYTNTAAGLTTSAIGVGSQWIPIERLAIFTNISAGLTASTPSIFSLVGFAVAF
jgi:hypothetical protein